MQHDVLYFSPIEAESPRFMGRPPPPRESGSAPPSYDGLSISRSEPEIAQLASYSSVTPVHDVAR